jgi:GTP:adenosylcobinamide-phosphate guanylyltransferase
MLSSVVDAVVLAGGVDRGEIAEETGVIHRPLLDVAGRPIIRRVLAALRGAVSVDRIVLVAPTPVQDAVGEEAVDTRVDAGDSFIDNIERGVAAALGTTDSVLIITGDLPLLTPGAVNDLVEQAALTRTDLVYPIIPKESSERSFPGGKRTYVTLREGTFTGGNGVVAARNFVSARRELIQRLFAARKHPIKLASIFGLGFILGLLTRRLTLSDVESRAGEIVGGRVAAIITIYAELGFDVDKIDDLLLARRVAETFDTE